MSFIRRHVEFNMGSCVSVVKYANPKSARRLDTIATRIASAERNGQRHTRPQDGRNPLFIAAERRFPAISELQFQARKKPMGDVV